MFWLVTSIVVLCVQFVSFEPLYIENQDDPISMGYDVWQYAKKNDTTMCVDSKCIRNRANDGQVFFTHRQYILSFNINTIPYFMSFGIYNVFELDAKYRPVLGRVINFKWSPTLFYVGKEMTNRTICPSVVFYPENAIIERQFKEDSRQSCLDVTASSMNGFAFVGNNENIGILNVQTSIFTRNGYSIHGYFNETQRGDVRVNFTLHQWKWCNNCGIKGAPSKFIEIWMYIKGTRMANEFLKFGTGDGPRKGYTVGTGNVVLSGLTNVDNHFRRNMPMLYREPYYRDRNLFRLVIPRFNKFASYEGIYMKLNSTSTSIPRTKIYPY